MKIFGVQLWESREDGLRRQQRECVLEAELKNLQRQTEAFDLTSSPNDAFLGLRDNDADQWATLGGSANSTDRSNFRTEVELANAYLVSRSHCFGITLSRRLSRGDGLLRLLHSGSG